MTYTGIVDIFIAYYLIATVINARHIGYSINLFIQDGCVFMLVYTNVQHFDLIKFLFSARYEYTHFSTGLNYSLRRNTNNPPTKRASETKDNKKAVA